MKEKESQLMHDTFISYVRCILGALSPAVTVPGLVNLQDRQYGIAKGIPTMCLAAGGLDNVLCVTAFAVFLGINFSDGIINVFCGSFKKRSLNPITS